MYRLCFVLSLCVFGALAYRMDYDLEELQGRQFADSEKAECIKDIVIVLDTSRSVGKTSFQAVKKFLQKLVTNEALNVKKAGTRIGFVIFSEPKKTDKKLDIGQIHDAKKLEQYMGNLRWEAVEGGLTRTDLGLKKATEMFVNYKKNEPGRSKFGDVAIVITDGKPRGITNDDRGIAKDAATALKAQGVLVIGAGVGNDFSSTESSKGPTEVAKLKQFMRDIATSPENVIFQENFENINSIIGKLVADSCIGDVKCTCPEEQKTQPFYTDPGESTATLDLPGPMFECYDGTKPYVAKTLNKEVQPALPKDNKFPVAETTYNYKFTLNKGGPLTCPYTVVVRRASCSCDEIETLRYVEPGKSTVKIDLPAPAQFTCVDNRGVEIKTTTVNTDIQPAPPAGNNFGVGTKTYEYIFTLIEGAKVKCPVTVVVRKRKQCRGVAYDSVAKVCCCGSIHDKKSGYKCCGPDYYNPRNQQCCDGANLISARETCLE